MDISALLERISLEIRAFVAAPDRRAYLLARLDTFYGDTIEPLNLPGPDWIIDPALRIMLQWLAASLYDALAPMIERGDSITWSEPPPAGAQAPTEPAQDDKEVPPCND